MPWKQLGKKGSLLSGSSEYYERGREGQKNRPAKWCGAHWAAARPGDWEQAFPSPGAPFTSVWPFYSAISPKDWTMPLTVFLSRYPKDRGIWYPFQDTTEEVTFFPFSSGVHSPRVLWFAFQLSSHCPWILKTTYLTARLRWFGNADLTFKWCRYVFIENLCIQMFPFPWSLLQFSLTEWSIFFTFIIVISISTLIQIGIIFSFIIAVQSIMP